MTSLPTLFLNNLLPIFLIAGAGYLIGGRLQIQPRSLSQIVFYILSPCLIFNLIIKSQLGDQEILRILAFAGLVIGLIGLLTWLAGRLLNIERRTLAAVMLTSMFMNAGNYGLPVVLFAFGETAVAYASLFFVTNAILTNTAGVVIASLGNTNLKKALTNLFKIPALYALIIGLVVQRTGWQLPTPLARPLDILGGAAIASMLLLLGLQLRTVKWAGKQKPLALASVMRLVVSPAIALGLSHLLGLTGPARQAGILEAAMPAAVLTTVLATEFNIEPEFVTTIVLVTTLLSAFTLTPLLAYLSF